MAKWASPDRQAHLVKLFTQSQGFCVYGHTPCAGKWERQTITLCVWKLPRTFRCPDPVANGEPCRFKPEEGKPHLPCNTFRLEIVRWHCAYGDYPCYEPYECHHELYTNRLIRDWASDDKAQSQAEWEAERKQLHALGEQREPIRGRFNTISKDIFFANQPLYYLDGLGMSGLTFKPFAKVRLAGSFMYLHIDLGDTLKAVSKSKRRKAIRYGKPLPQSVTGRIKDLCYEAVRHYLNS